MRIAILVLLLLAGLLNLLPALGVLGVDRLRRLYAVSIASPDLEILLRHRALLFAIVGGWLVAAAIRPELRSAAIAAGLASMLGFIAIAHAVGGANAALTRVVAADWIGSGALVVAGLLELWFRAAR